MSFPRRREPITNNLINSYSKVDLIMDSRLRGNDTFRVISVCTQRAWSILYMRAVRAVGFEIGKIVEKRQ
jgi:hypothetical protein